MELVCTSSVCSIAPLLVELVRQAFPDNGNGSRILLTTRIFDLARSAHHVHEMDVLDEHRSWDMLRELIFKGDPCPSQLEHFGKTIAERCQGIPLSIAVVSGLLASDQTEAAWEDVSEYKSYVSEADFVLSQRLSLSYTYLPRHLKPCFLYLRCFAEDSEIRLSNLIKLWAAEGFLEQSEYKSFEETGEECVEGLVRRGLVSIHSRKSNGRIKSILVHDLVRDWCMGATSRDNFTLHVSRSESFDQQAMAMEFESSRRIIISNCSHDILEGVYDPTIRTIIICLNYGEVVVRWSIRNVRLLRILDLSNAYDYDLPEEVFELFHLRYLAFNCGFRISEAISNLQNLQTLIICPREKGGVFHKLPEGIWRMPQLRHLFNFYFKLPSLGGGGENSALENLETLSTIVDFVCSRENLKMIPNLKNLSLLYTMESRDVVGDYELHNLICLLKIQTLKIELMDWSFGEEYHKMNCVFPPTLKKLNLCGVQFSREGIRFVASLPNLEVLKLRWIAFESDTWMTNEGGFSRLKYLLIEESNLVLWITGITHFPRLKSLLLRCCLHLSKVPNEIGKIPTLELIE